MLLVFSLQLRGLGSHHSAQPTSDGFGEETPSRLSNERPNSAKSSDVLVDDSVSRLKFKDEKRDIFCKRDF